MSFNGNGSNKGENISLVESKTLVVYDHPICILCVFWLLSSNQCSLQSDKICSQACLSVNKLKLASWLATISSNIKPDIFQIFYCDEVWHLRQCMICASENSCQIWLDSKLLGVQKKLNLSDTGRLFFSSSAPVIKFYFLHTTVL